MTEILNDLYRKTVFHLKWAFMSPQKRYAYLWNRTKRTHYHCYEGGEQI
jgi:hemolysin-activating ACP:hemolysin acyltransferase